MRKKTTPVDVPKVWLDRDPRNRDHLKAAYELVARLSEIYATEKTFKELAGFDIPKNVKKLKRHPKVHVVIGGFFHLDEGLQVAENVICTCADCRAPMQIRPHSNTGNTVLCCFCYADRVLKEYWAKQAAPPVPPRRAAARQP